MAEQLQGLLEKLHGEGVKKAEEERLALVAKAKAEVEALLKTAKEQADKIRRDADADAQKAKEKGEATVRQISRDIVINLENELNSRLNACVKNLVGAALTPELMAEIVREMLKSYSAKPGVEPTLELILPPNRLDELQGQLSQCLAADLKAQPEFFKGLDFSAGLKVGFKDSDVFFDFSDGALSEIIVAYAGPRLAAVLSGKPQG